MNISILLVDDHPLFRKGLRLLLEEETDLSVIGEAGDGQEALEQVQRLKPDVVVIDITMPNLSGIEATQQIVSTSPTTKILALSMHSGKQFVEDMLRAGAAGYLLKESAPEELVKGIRSIMQGHMCLSDSITNVVVSQYLNVLSSGKKLPVEVEDLTVLEREHIKLLAERASVERIASVFKISIEVAKSRYQQLMQKLNVQDIAEITEIASQLGLIEDHSLYYVGNEKYSTPIIKTKIYKPPVPAGTLPRKKLLDMLNTGRNKPLTLISAPAGYGKSTLVSLWLEACDNAGMWVSLSEDDNNIRSFLICITAAIEAKFPAVEQASQRVLNTLHLPSVSILTSLIRTDLEQIPEPFILVLDDYHHIHNQDVNDILTSWLRTPIKNMHITLLTRRDPALPITTLRAQGLLTEIGVEQLRFTVSETTTFLQEIIETPVEGDIAAVLEEKTEGWVTGLRLAALSLKNWEDLDRIVNGMQGDFYYVTEYLVSEVLSQQTETIARYLIDTSILNRFNAPLSEALKISDKKAVDDKNNIGGQEFIEWLIEENLFVISLDEKRHWFRYHHLFQQILTDQLKRRRSSEEIAALHLAASGWFAEQGLIEEAIKHALAANDTSLAANLVEKNRLTILNQDKWYILEKMLSMLPETLIQKRSGLLLAQTWMLYHQYEYQSIPSLLDAIEPLLSDDAADHCARGEVDFFRGYFAYFINAGTESLKRLKSAGKLVPVIYPETYGQVELVHGLTMQMEGHKDVAIHQLHEALYRCGISSNVRKTRLLIALVYIHIIAGDLSIADRINDELFEVSTAGKCSYACAWSIYLKGAICFFRNDMDMAINFFEQMMDMKYILHRRAAIDGMAGLAFAYNAVGEESKANETMECLFEYLIHQNISNYTTLAYACQARLWLMQGKTDPALTWLSTIPSPPVENMFCWIEILPLTCCRILISQGSDTSIEQAIEKLQEHFSTNNNNHNTMHLINILLLMAVAYEKKSSMDKALEFLEQALELALPGEWLQPFLELGSPMANLLERVVQHSNNANYIEKIQAAFKRGTSGMASDAKNEISVEPSPVSVPPIDMLGLTRREIEILRLLDEGLSNKEIASKIFLSTETIKKHLYNSYQKIGVHGRVNALTKVREMGLLPRV